MGFNRLIGLFNSLFVERMIHAVFSVQCAVFILFVKIEGMSFRRALNIRKVIPQRGLEEFLGASTAAGKDTVYGLSWICF